MTEWRPCTANSDFEVSSDGDVRNIHTRNVIQGSMAGSRRQYRSVRLGRRIQRTVHTLICEAFHGPRPTPHHQVAHNNGVSTDNRAENLRWATRSENMRDAVRHGTISRYNGGSGEANGKAKLTTSGVRQMRQLRAEGWTCARIAELFGISRSTAKDVLSGRTWRHVA